MGKPTEVMLISGHIEFISDTLWDLPRKITFNNLTINYTKMLLFQTTIYILYVT